MSVLISLQKRVKEDVTIINLMTDKDYLHIGYRLKKETRNAHHKTQPLRTKNKHRTDNSENVKHSDARKEKKKSKKKNNEIMFESKCDSCEIFV